MLKTKLFKRTALGIYQIEISLIPNVHGSIIKTDYGLLGGKQIHGSKAGTNKEYESIIARHKKEGYKSNTDLGLYVDGDFDGYELNALLPAYNTDENNYSKPMKCQPFVPNKFSYPALGQPKINGVRATIRWAYKNNGLFSDWGVLIKSHEGIVYNIKHIEEIFTKVFTKDIKGDINRLDLVFDGEIYKFGEHVTSISGAARNPNNPIHPYLQFHCFDLAIPDISQKERIEIRDKVLNGFSPKDVFDQLVIAEHKTDQLQNAKIVVVKTMYLNDDSDSDEMRNNCLNNSYEGCVIRDMEATYRFGSRPKTMMKLKRFKYGTFLVKDIVSFGLDTNSTTNVGKGVKFILKNDITDDTFECNPLGELSSKLQWLKNKKDFIGTFVKVKYGERTINNLPFHANVIIE